MRLPSIIMTDLDRERLATLIEQHDAGANAVAADLLDSEVRRATIVAQSAVPPTVVTMNSRVVYEDVGTGRTHEVEIVYPKDASAGDHRISVLAPVGRAILGLSIGQSVKFALPSGKTTEIRIVEVTYQPEAAGHYNR